MTIIEGATTKFSRVLGNIHSIINRQQTGFFNFSLNHITFSTNNIELDL